MSKEQEAGRDAPDKGFAGLLSMVSNVDAVLAKAAPARKSKGGEPPAPLYHGLYMAPPQPSAHLPASSSWGGVFGIVIALVVVVLSVIGKVGSRDSKPTQVDGFAQQMVQTSVMTSATIPGLTVEKPPMGVDNILGLPQIRYCLAETIRLEAGKAVVNVTRVQDVQLFNALVSDFNLHCGQYRYQPEVYEAAKADVEGLRPSLETQGRERFGPARGRR